MKKSSSVSDAADHDMKSVQSEGGTRRRRRPSLKRLFRSGNKSSSKSQQQQQEQLSEKAADDWATNSNNKKESAPTSKKKKATTTSTKTASASSVPAAAPRLPVVSEDAVLSTTTTTSSTNSPTTKKQPKSILKASKTNGTTGSSTAAVSSNKKSNKFSWFCKTAHFTKLCNAAFDMVDADNSGSVDESELYSGLLLIHLKLGTYAGPAACRPLSRERCRAIFEKFDTDSSKTLDRDEFRQVMMVLFSNVIFRVAVQWSMTLLIVPLAAQAILDGIVWCVAKVLEFIANLDEYSTYANSTELYVEDVAAWCVDHSPRAFHKIAGFLAIIPESVWSAVPLAILSTILGICVVPWCIFQVDDYFQRLADKKAAQKRQDKEKGKWI